jgi:hypothetical protein
MLRNQNFIHGGFIISKIILQWDFPDALLVPLSPVSDLRGQRGLE